MTATSFCKPLVWMSRQGSFRVLHLATHSCTNSALLFFFSQLAKDLLSIFLFPDLSDGQPGQVSRVPVLKDTVREDLYNLVLSLSKTQDDLDNILGHIDGLVAKGQYCLSCSFRSN
jgi:hypothetical protein